MIYNLCKCLNFDFKIILRNSYENMYVQYLGYEYEKYF